MARDRRVDVVGVLVLLGIAVGTGLGLASGNARLVLLEGSVPTVVFGAVCLGSLWTRRPLMYRFAVDFIGPETPRVVTSPTDGGTQSPPRLPGHYGGK
jgi:hypothetical protein